MVIGKKERKKEEAVTVIAAVIKSDYGGGKEYHMAPVTDASNPKQDPSINNKQTQSKYQMDDRSRIIAKEDRISNLSDGIIHHILSFLDMKYAVQTSALSVCVKIYSSYYRKMS
ncbi:hypothetical protein OSB04_019795 [Centaurea solstitialis]|uniref:F-box domain-containing protein n=1 Tax=Centaurea solstitialis TaxID=347529 RepID=A0AA38W388_9ASTR|nr:hypothetical protein OSB04_019795 [Centaurea solstitialis]